MLLYGMLPNYVTRQQRMQVTQQSLRQSETDAETELSNIMKHSQLSLLN